MIFLLFALFNFWIWKILTSHALLGLVLLASTLLLYLSYKNPKYTHFFLASFLILVYFQYNTTTLTPLTYETRAEKNLHQQRLNSYPPIYLTIFQRKIYLPVAHNLENREPLKVLEIFQNNLVENFDINQFFFGGHPREGTYIHRSSKFPFIYFFPFIAGLFYKGYFNRHLIRLAFILPLIVLTFIGMDNKYGAFSLFPAIVYTTYTGGQPFLLAVKRLFK